jgi:TRAP-type mannitol/chloroaromatic compound transport system permease small subunit
MHIPTIMKRIFGTWKKIGLWLGKAVAWIVLVTVYGVVFAPIALVMRFQYNKERAQKRQSYFVDHDASSDARYEHQF